MSERFDVSSIEGITRCIEFLEHLESHLRADFHTTAANLAQWLSAIVNVEALAIEELALIDIQLNQRLADLFVSKLGEVDLKYRIIDMVLASDQQCADLLRRKAKLQRLQKLAERLWQAFEIKARLTRASLDLASKEFSSTTVRTVPQPNL